MARSIVLNGGTLEYNNAGTNSGTFTPEILVGPNGGTM